MGLLKLLFGVIFFLFSLAWLVFWCSIGLLVMFVSGGFGFFIGLGLVYVGAIPLGSCFGLRLAKRIERGVNPALGGSSEYELITRR